MIFVINCQFSYLFFLGKLNHENVFQDILDIKNALLDYKNIKLKQWKKKGVPKGLVHDFCEKLAVFLSFYFRQNRPGKCVYDILYRKNAFLDYKNIKLKKLKNWDFLKGVSPWYLSKIRNFSIFLILFKMARKMCFTIFFIEKTPF